MNTGTMAGIGGFARGLAHGIETGVRLGIELKRWDREQVEKVERSEFMSVAGLYGTLLNSKPGTEYDLKDVPIPQSLRFVLKGATPSKAVVRDDGVEFIYNGGSAVMPKEQIQFNFDRANVMLQNFYGLRIRDKKEDTEVKIMTREITLPDGTSIKRYYKTWPDGRMEPVDGKSDDEAEYAALVDLYNSHIASTYDSAKGKFAGILGEKDRNRVRADQLWYHIVRKVKDMGGDLSFDEAPHKVKGGGKAIMLPRDPRVFIERSKPAPKPEHESVKTPDRASAPPPPAEEEPPSGEWRQEKPPVRSVYELIDKRNRGELTPEDAEKIHRDMYVKYDWYRKQFEDVVSRSNAGQ